MPGNLFTAVTIRRRSAAHGCASAHPDADRHAASGCAYGSHRRSAFAAEEAHEEEDGWADEARESFASARVAGLWSMAMHAPVDRMAPLSYSHLNRTNKTRGSVHIERPYLVSGQRTWRFGQRFERFLVGSSRLAPLPRSLFSV